MSQSPFFISVCWEILLFRFIYHHDNKLSDPMATYLTHIGIESNAILFKQTSKQNSPAAPTNATFPSSF